jgi:hypothetical protein
MIIREAGGLVRNLIHDEELWKVIRDCGEETTRVDLYQNVERTTEGRLHAFDVYAITRTTLSTQTYIYARPGLKNGYQDFFLDGIGRSIRDMDDICGRNLSMQDSSQGWLRGHHGWKEQ